MGEPMLRVNSLCVEYKTRTGSVFAVNGVDFSISKGEVLGIVGETGAGKTTTALSVMRLLPERTGVITQGRILYKDRDIVQLSEREMRGIRGAQIAMVFQDPMSSLNPVMTVGAQIRESILLHRLDDLSDADMDRRVDEVLHLVGIDSGRRHDYPHQFSGGMKQRVVIAMALACKPDLLIADEPTTALDVTIQAQVLSMISQLRKQIGMAMLMISHDLGVIAQTCDRVCVMYAGQIIESGTIADVFDGIKHHPYTEGLFGSIPSLNAESERLHPIPGMMPDLSEKPKGCAFFLRCPKRLNICETLAPDPHIDGTHTRRCHLFSEGGQLH